ncbi:MAG TPA: citrate/2-methylcitrate synthase, partial [Bacteroidales bacterium]|nr:citrate/2-methylcitrate synthase [Bacteroidales bacterium]
AAENFLYMLKGEGNYTSLDADMMDLSLVLHAEHGGGNNSSFTTRVTSSSGTDTYSSIASAVGSLKGPYHGGANLRVLGMMDNIKENVKSWTNEYEVLEYLIKILNKEAHNRTGKLYGIGHAVYTKSDPRTLILKNKARDLAKEKGMEEEYELYSMVERLAPEAFRHFKKDSNKVLCANVDFYSGLVYSCIGIPKEIWTPLFAIARIAGWSAHRLEELNFSARRIIRPAYKFVASLQEYIPLDKR